MTKKTIELTSLGDKSHLNQSGVKIRLNLNADFLLFWSGPFTTLVFLILGYLISPSSSDLALSEFNLIILCLCIVLFSALHVIFIAEVIEFKNIYIKINTWYWCLTVEQINNINRGIIFFFYFILRLDLVLNPEFLVNYWLEMNPDSGNSGSSNLSTENTQLGHTNNQPVPARDPKTSEVVVKIWPDSSPLSDINQPYVEKKVDFLKVGLQPASNGKPGMLFLSDSEQGPATRTATYVIASVGIHDVHIQPDKVQLFNSKQPGEVKTIEDAGIVQLRAIKRPAIAIDTKTSYISYMGRATPNFRVGGAKTWIY